MAINVVHSASAGTAGSVARQAGLGQYSKFMQQMIAQENAHRANRQQQSKMQERTIAAQGERDVDYQAFQKELGQTKFDQGLQMLEAREQMGIDAQERGVAQNGWQNYVGSIKNWKDWSPQQKNDFQAQQNAVGQVIGHKGLRPEEKANAIRQAISNVQAIQQGIVPKEPTQQDQWKAEGKGVGDTWINTMTGDTETRDDKGNVKVHKKAMTVTEYSKASSDVAKSLATEAGAADHKDVVDRLDQMGIRMYVNPAETFLSEIPNVAERLGVTVDEIEKMPPEEKEKLKRFEELETRKLQDDGAQDQVIEEDKLNAAQEVIQQYPQAAQSLGITPEMATRMSPQLLQAIPVIEAEFKKLGKNPNTENARALRRVILKLKLQMGG